MLLRIATAIAVSLCLAVGISACGGSSSSGSSSSSSSGGAADNGVSAKSATQIVAASKQSIQGITSVHVAGATTSDNTPLALDLKLVAGKGGTGQMTIQGQTLNIVTLGQSVYIKADAAFWTKFANAQAAGVLKDKWLKAPSNGSFASFAQLTDITKLFDQLLGDHGTLAKGSTTTVNGQKVIGINDTTKHGTLYIATTGKPYPVEITNGPSKIVFDQVNQPVPLAAPSGAIAFPSS